MPVAFLICHEIVSADGAVGPPFCAEPTTCKSALITGLTPVVTLPVLLLDTGSGRAELEASKAVTENVPVTPPVTPGATRTVTVAVLLMPAREFLS